MVNKTTSCFTNISAPKVFTLENGKLALGINNMVSSKPSTKVSLSISFHVWQSSLRLNWRTNVWTERLKCRPMHRPMRESTLLQTLYLRIVSDTHMIQSFDWSNNLVRNFPSFVRPHVLLNGPTNWYHFYHKGTAYKTEAVIFPRRFLFLILNWQSLVHTIQPNYWCVTYLVMKEIC